MAFFIGHSSLASHGVNWNFGQRVPEAKVHFAFNWISYWSIMGIWITLWSAMKYVLRHMEECLPDLMVSKFRPIHPIHRFCSDISLELIGKLCPTFGGCGGVRVKIWGATVRQVNQNLCSCCFSFYANPRICGGYFFFFQTDSCLAAVKLATFGALPCLDRHYPHTPVFISTRECLTCLLSVLSIVLALTVIWLGYAS